METVTLYTLECAIERIKKDKAGSPENVGNTELTLEYVLASFFPKSYQQYQKLLNDTALTNFKAGYNEGFIDGQKSQNNLTTEDL